MPPPPKSQETEISANGQKFRCKQWDAGQSRSSALLLHGFPQNLNTWDDHATNLAASGYCVHAFDQRGYAPSSAPDDPAAYNFDAFVADTLKLDAFYLAGFGMGAAQVWILAARYPKRVRAGRAAFSPSGGFRLAPDA